MLWLLLLVFCFVWVFVLIVCLDVSLWCWVCGWMGRVVAEVSCVVVALVVWLLFGWLLCLVVCLRLALWIGVGLACCYGCRWFCLGDISCDALLLVALLGIVHVAVWCFIISCWLLFCLLLFGIASCFNYWLAVPIYVAVGCFLGFELFGGSLVVLF